MQHTRRHRVPEHARSVGEHAGVRRAPCDEDACAKLGGAAGWRRSQRGRALVQRAVGTGAVSGERGGESSRGGEDAGAHARHMRRRTPGLRQLTLHPRPISRLSSASLPSLVASFTALPIAALELPIAALELQEPICSARCWRQVLAGRESRPTSSLTRNRSRKKSGSRGPKGAKRDKLHEGASTGTGRAPELAARASAHAR